MSLGKQVPDSAVEHASVEVYAIVPLLQHHGLLMLNQRLVSLVVCLDSVLPVRLLEEVVRFHDHLLEECVRLVAGNHRLTEQDLRVLHDLVTILVFLVMVLTEGILELTVKHVDLNGATSDVVSVIIFLVCVGVEETSVPLSGCVRWQVRVFERRRQVFGLMEHLLVNLGVLRGIRCLVEEAMNV